MPPLPLRVAQSTRQAQVALETESAYDSESVKNVPRMTETMIISVLAVFYVATIRPVADTRNSRTGRMGRFF